MVDPGRMASCKSVMAAITEFIRTFLDKTNSFRPHDTDIRPTEMAEQTSGFPYFSLRIQLDMRIHPPIGLSKMAGKAESISREMFTAKKLGIVFFLRRVKNSLKTCDESVKNMESVLMEIDEAIDRKSVV